jgi:predicted nuclease with TOPRIM domain
VTASGEGEVIAQEVSGLGHKVDDLERRLAEVEKVNARLEGAALQTARALQEISQHWDAVYEAMRRAEEPAVDELLRERTGPRSSKP